MTPYRAVRAPGDARRLVIHPERGAGTRLLIGLGMASAALGGVMVTVSPIAGIAVALASTAFSGWLGTEAWVTRVELLRDEREGRLQVKWRALGDDREVFIALDDVLDVVLEINEARMVRFVLRLKTGQRVPLTPFSAGESGSSAELARELSAHVQGT